MHSLIEVFCASFVELELGQQHTDPRLVIILNMRIRIILVDRQLKEQNLGGHAYTCSSSIVECISRGWYIGM